MGDYYLETLESTNSQLEEEIQKLQAEITDLSELSCIAIQTLDFYADPECYHALMIIPDRPCGPFMDDVSEDHGHYLYDRPMPGKLAREALEEMQTICRKGNLHYGLDDEDDEEEDDGEEGNEQ